MTPKRYNGKLTIAEALKTVRHILRDNAPGSGNTFEGSLGPPTSARCQALRRLGQVAASRDRADRKSAANRAAIRKQEASFEHAP